MIKGPAPVAALLVLTACSGGEPNVGLAPDMHFWLDCQEQLDDAGQAVIEEGLFTAGFDVLNTARAAREQQVEYPYPVKIEALDKHGRVVSIHGFEPNSGFKGKSDRPFTTSASLFTNPPTRRNAKLEETILSVMSKKPSCSVRDVQRNSNGPASEAVYQDTIKRTKGWFDQARAMGSSSKAVRVH